MQLSWMIEEGGKMRRTISLSDMKKLMAVLDEIHIPYDFYHVYDIYEYMSGEVLEIKCPELDCDELDEYAVEYNRS